MAIKPFKRILVVRNDRFGEFLLIIPALRTLKEKFPDASITAVVNPYVRGLALDVPYIDEIIPWERKRHTLPEKFRLLKEIRAKRFDCAIIFNPSKEFNLFTFLAGIPERVGFNRKWGFLLNHKVQDEKHLGQKHEIEYNLDLVGAIGAKTNDISLGIRIDEGLAKEEADIILHPFTSDPIKQWPLDNFRQLTDRIVGESRFSCAIIGVSSEPKDFDFFTGLDKRVKNLIGKTDLRELAALLKKSKLLISCDSGPVHLASCAGTRVVALFRNDIPGKSARRWGPRSAGSFVIEKSRLSDISVEEVLSRVKEVLDK